MKCRKVGHIPAKADPEAQAVFKETQLDPLLAQAQAGERKLFLDAAHFALAPYVGFLGSFVRLFIQTPAGRKRFNVLGALDAISHELVMVSNDSDITAETVKELFIKLRTQFPDSPITLVLDNARYQNCHLVWQAAQDLNLDWLTFPLIPPISI